MKKQTTLDHAKEAERLERVARFIAKAQAWKAARRKKPDLAKYRFPTEQGK